MNNIMFVKDALVHNAWSWKVGQQYYDFDLGKSSCIVTPGIWPEMLVEFLPFMRMIRCFVADFFIDLHITNSVNYTCI